MDAFTGEIRIFGFSYAPIDWAYCNGAQVLYQQNPALYSILGTYYGGTVGQNFNLPNMQGCLPIGQGTGPGLSTRTIGQTVGAEGVTLNANNLPSHNHNANVVSAASSTKTAGPATTAPLSLASQVLSNNVNINSFVLDPATPNTIMNPGVLQPFGAAAPAAHENRQPFLAMSYCICTQGYYPVRPN